MSGALRHAVYWVPAPGPFADFGAAWLGWDMARAQAAVQPDVPGLPRPLAALTASPRRYGFHATLKAPFRLASGRSADELAEAIASLAARLAPACADGLALARLGSFLALVPEGDASGIGGVAAEVVVGLDGFRAPAAEAELARRREAGLDAREDANLVRWGYPYVLESFHLHMTLTGPLAPDEARGIETALSPLLAGLRPQPFILDALAHVAEGADGCFRLVRRYRLSG